MPFWVKMFKKRTCLLHTLCFPFHETEAEDSEDLGDGKVIGWKDPGPVDQGDSSEPEQQHGTHIDEEGLTSYSSWHHPNNTVSITD